MTAKSSRIESIDILRGLVMVIMALDHVRDYFHRGAFFVDPMDLENTNGVLFFTRFITHYCAPVFVFLAGTSAFLYGQRKTKQELSKFLITRGIWLIAIEVIVNNFIWTFDFSYSLQIFQVIWAIGACMVLLGLLVYLPKKVLIAIGLILVISHNALDGIVMQGTSLKAILWYIWHQDQFLVINSGKMIAFHYPLMPWVGVMVLGYVFGHFYRKEQDPTLRQNWILRIGLLATGLFFIIRGFNVYGDLVPWTTQKDGFFTFLSFMKVSKYPPSLVFLLITIGPSLLFLSAIEGTKNKITDFLLVFGRVPLFYYLLHVLVIHLIAILTMAATGQEWQHMILTADVFMNAKLINYGYSLLVVYLLWILIVALLYPICKNYMRYKASKKHLWWMSYL